jgi:hydrogenase maturation protease
MGDSKMSVIIIGVGNPMLSDDSVGLQVVGRLAKRLKDCPDIRTLLWYAGGISLMEAMRGHEKAIIIDAILTEYGKPGTIYPLTPSDLRQSKNAHSTHDGNLAVALELGRMLGLPLPEQVKIWAVEAEDVATFSEALTEQVERAVPSVVGQVLRELRETASSPGEQL